MTKSQPTDFPLVRGEDGEAVPKPVKEYFRIEGEGLLISIVFI
jgi:hypothetical protein